MKGKDLRFAVLFDVYGGMLTEKQRDVIDYYYNEDLSLAEIAEHEGISRQGVRDNIKRGEAFMLEMEERLGFLRQDEETGQFLSRIDELARQIREVNARYVSNNQIGALAAEISRLIREYRGEDEGEENR